MFTVRPFENRTLSWWNDERFLIDLSPPYQRSSGIWNREDKAFLIDSIINGFDVPKIYIADFTYVNTPLNERQKSYAVIDGKQRLEAIFDFFSGRLVLDENFEYFANPSLKLAGLGLKDLRESHHTIARSFENFNLSVMSVITDDESKINELFTRLNRSKPLTGAELRNAMQGEVPALLRELSSHPFFSRCVRFGQSRGQALNAAAKILLTEFRGKFVETKKKQLDQLVVDEGVLAEAPTFSRAKNRVKRNLNLMAKVFVEKDPLLGSQGPIVVYYWLVRTSSEDQQRLLREFLVYFDRLRKENRSASEAGKNAPIQELLEYDIQFRSINNTASQVYCYTVLSKYFTEFCAKR